MPVEPVEREQDLRVGGMDDRGGLAFADAAEAGAVIGQPIMRDAGERGVRPRAAQLLRLDALPRRALHEVGTAEPHERCALDHEDDIGKRR